MRRLLAAFAMAIAVQYPQVASAHEPYGGCDEAYLYADSRGADHCRDHGWDIPIPAERSWWWQSWLWWMEPRHPWRPFRDVEGHTGCEIRVGGTSYVRCSDGFRAVS